MGNENDKRLNQTDANQGNPAAHSQKLPNQNINLNNTQQNERPTAYSQNKTPNQANIGVPPINANNNNASSLPRSLSLNRNTITKKMLRDAFKTYSIDGSYLNKPRFNDAIESIFRFNIPEMHYTHLCNKIYELLDNSGDGKIQEDEFLEGMEKVLKDKDFRLLLSMMAMMSGDKSRDYIEVKEIKEFFYLSYVEGFKHLGWQIKRNKEDLEKNNIPFVTIQQLEKWASKQKKEIEANIEMDLKEFDPNITTAISFQQFLRWITRDHTIYIKYGNKNIMIATSLIKLEEINYDERIA